jgi:hypothetical protein
LLPIRKANNRAMSPLVKSGHRSTVLQGPLSRLEYELFPEPSMQIVEQERT